MGLLTRLGQGLQVPVSALLPNSGHLVTPKDSGLDGGGGSRERGFLEKALGSGDPSKRVERGRLCLSMEEVAGRVLLQNNRKTGRAAEARPVIWQGQVREEAASQAQELPLSAFLEAVPCSRGSREDENFLGKERRAGE